MTFGIETDTLDITGNIVERDSKTKKITTKDIETVHKKIYRQNNPRSS